MFLLCAMGLQSLLHKAESDGLIRVVSICRNRPCVSHLLFMDDSILFCRAKEYECQFILDLLAIYEKGSRQKINRDKTNIFFFQLKHSPGRANSYTETFKCPLPLRNIWGPLPLLEELKNRFLSILKKVFGKSLKVRKKSFYLKLEGG